jgi:hypothetical protein
MPRALLGLIMLAAATVAGCDREPAAPAPPAGHAEQPAPASVPEVDISGLDEGPALVAMMKQRIAADDREEQAILARFTPVAADMLLKTPVKLLPEELRPADLESEPDFVQAMMQLVETQVPAEARAAIREKGQAKVLVVELCEAGVGMALGIPSDYDEGSPAQYLDQARFEVAMEREGLKPIPLPDDFRDMEAEREPVAALNARLFGLYKSGVAKDILVVVDLSDGCGAGEMPVKLVSDPPYKSLRIIPEFYFAVCGKRSPDAWSPQQCRWWEDVLQDVTMVSGTYYYAATWPDGVEKRGRFTIDEQAAAALAEGQETLTLDIKQ